MNKQKVKLSLHKLQWEILSDDVKTAFTKAPVKGWELESYIIAELYMNKKMFFDVYPHTSKGVTLSLTMVQAIAVNRYFSQRSIGYVSMLQILIEPKLILG